MSASPVSITVEIGGKEWSHEELDEVFLERALFNLHEMHILGAVLRGTDGRVLTEAGIDEICDTEVRKTLLDNRLRIGKKRLDRLYDEQYREADRMWRDIVSESVPGDYSKKVARAHLVITGLGVREYAKVTAASFKLKRLLLSVEPDHIDASGLSVTEVMGQYGRPTQMKGGLTRKAPGPKTKSHYLRLIGASHLTADPDITNAVAMHQVRPIKGGLDFLAAAHFPTATPQGLVDGHSIHMGIEVSNLFRNVLGE